MKCPQCGHDNPSDASFCDQCDHIMDDSFLNPETDEDALATSKLDIDDVDEKTPTQSFDSIEAPAEDEALDTWRNPLSEETVNMEPQSVDDTNPPEADAVERERARLKAQRQVRNGPAIDRTPKGPKVDEFDRINKDIQGLAAKVRAFYARSHQQDKLTLVACFIMMVMCFMPWVTVVGDNDYIGLERDAWLALFLGAGVISCVYLRNNKDWREKKKILLYAQTTMAALIILFFLSELADMRPVTILTEQLEGKNLVEELASKAQFGLVGGFFSSVLLAAGTAFRLKAFLEEQAQHGP